MDLSKVYDPKQVEEKIYKLWLKSGFFNPDKSPAKKTKKPFTILLPLPNANDPLHMGHALFTIEDIMARYHRMLGEPVLWLPEETTPVLKLNSFLKRNWPKKEKAALILTEKRFTK